LETDNCRPFTLAFMPCYNEAQGIAGVIQKTLDCGVDWVIVSDDGSRDNSLEVLQKVGRETKRVFILRLIENRGVAVAKITGFALAWLLFRNGVVPSTTLLVKLDSDGQHDPRFIPAMIRDLEKRQLDFLLSFRDFSVYPWFKVVGNRAVSLFASALTLHRCRDSMSGLKVMRMPVVGEILAYFTGYRYAAAQEITIIPALTGSRCANDFRVEIPIYRSGSGISDGASVLRMSLASWWRVHRRQRQDPDQRSRALLSDPNVQLILHPPEAPYDRILPT